MLKVPDSHKKKYANFIKLIEDTKAKVVEPDFLIVASPEVLGDNYEELIINLGLLAEAGLALRIGTDATPAQD